MENQCLAQAAATREAESGEVLARDIRALRKARGLTLAEIALKLGRSVGWVSQVERGLSTPSLADMRAFAALFDVTIEVP